MTKILKIQGVIEPEILDNLSKQIEDLELQEGDQADVLFDSVGGAVDVAFCIAESFEEMQEAGIKLRAVAEGKVYSSAIVPFLAIRDRTALKGSSFFVHKATYQSLSDIDKDQLRELQNELEEYTDMLYDFYDDHGISRDVRVYLKEGDGIMIDKPADMIDSGFISKVVNQRAQIYNRLMRGLDRIFPSAPNFSFIHNHQQINDNFMTRKQIKELIQQEFKEAAPEFARAVAVAVKNELTPDPDDPEEPTNEATAMSPDELGKLDGKLFKTSATIEGSDVAYLVHLGKTIGAGCSVIPISEDGSVVQLSDGDHVATIDGSEHTISSTEGGYQIDGSAPGNQDPEEPENNDNPEFDADPEPENTNLTEPENVDDPEPEPENTKPAPINQKPKSAAPRPSTQKAPVANKNKHAKEMFEMFKGYGMGCTGYKE